MVVIGINLLLPLFLPYTFTSKGSGKAVSINPNEIRFSQSSVNGAEEIIQSMKANGWKGDPIDVIKMSDGKLTTIDNTRVVTIKWTVFLRNC